MKKNYLEPEMKLAFFEKEDIVTSSGDPGDQSANSIADDTLRQRYGAQGISIQSVDWTF